MAQVNNRLKHMPNLTLKPDQVKAVKSLRVFKKHPKQKEFILSGVGGTGKSQPLTTILQTPNGPVLMKDAYVGMPILSDNCVTQVDGVFPQGVRDSYEIHFNDGSHTTCCEEHLWNVQTRRQYQKGIFETKSLKDIIDSKITYKEKNSIKELKYRIPLIPALYSKNTLLLDPYVMGCLLGDGGFTSGGVILSNPIKKLRNEVKSILGSDYELTTKKKDLDYYIKYTPLSKKNPLIDSLKHYDLYGKKSIHKHIPKDYLYSSVFDRLRLLNGLMDTDGTIDKRSGVISFSSSSLQLANDVQSLCRSLGYLAYKIGPKVGSYRKKGVVVECNTHYRFTISTNTNPFTIYEKAQYFKIKCKYPPARRIKKIIKAGREEMQCIKVRSESGLYLCNDCIVTHNTTIIRELFKRKQGKNTYINKNVLGITVSHKARINLSKSIPNSITYASALNLKQELDDFGNTIYVPKNDKYLVTPIGKYSHIVIDEASMVSHEMLEQIRENAQKGAKIYYLGDWHQLKPVMQKTDDDSPVFSLEQGYELTEKVRQQKGDYIADLCDQTCLSIDTDHNMDFVKNMKSSHFNKSLGKGYVRRNKDAAMKSFVGQYEDGQNVRMTAFRKNTTADLNYQIRHSLFKDKADYPYVVGDLLMAASQYVVNSEPIFYNGEDLYVVSVAESTFMDIYCYRLYLKRVGERGAEELIDVPIYVVHPKGKAAYMNEYYKLKKDAIRDRSCWPIYFEFIGMFALLEYGYAVNNYKIQGTTLRGCYVDLTDILTTRPTSVRDKLQAMYVGFSRPTHQLAIF